MDVAPADCAVLVGVALRAPDFVRQVRAPQSHAALVARASTRSPDEVYARRWAQQAGHVGRILDDLHELGVLVVEEWARLEQLDLVTRGRAAVVVATHNTGAALQMHDAYAPHDTVAAAVGAYRGCLDLCSCRSIDLLPLVRAAAPDARLVIAKRKLSLVFHMSLIRATLRSLAVRPRPYEHALSEVAAEFVLRSME